MKRALRKTDTSMFVKADGGETQSIDMARHFISYDDAAAFCKNKHLTAVELVVRDDDQSEVTIKLQARHLR